MKYLIVTIMLVISCIGCSDNTATNRSDIDCEKLNDSLISMDNTHLGAIIDSICMTLAPMPISTDPIGHKQNSDQLIQELNESCGDLSFELGCYACLESLPLQSVVNVMMDSSGVELERSFNISVPEDDFMTFRN